MTATYGFPHLRDWVFEKKDRSAGLAETAEGKAVLCDDQAMRVSIHTREYPPFVYGGAGVHVAQLVPRLAKLVDVDVQCMGDPREGATAHPEDYPPGANGALRTFGADLSMVAAMPEVDVVHSHTWYANLAGHLAGLLHGVPHVLSAHSLNRPPVEARPARRRLQPVQLGRAHRLRGRLGRHRGQLGAA